MKKIGILLIVLMTISVGFMTGCTQQSGNNNENNTEPIVTPKYNEFVNWTIKTAPEVEYLLTQLNDIWAEEDWDNCLSYISQAKMKIDTYSNQILFFDLGGEPTLDSARNQFINWLNAYKQVYNFWEIAVQYFIAGDNATGNTYAQQGQDLLENTKTYADSYTQYIAMWRNEG